MVIDLLLAPYDEGERAVRMGRGPGRLVEAGIGERLRTGGHEVYMHTIESDVRAPTEIALAFDLARRMAERVAESRRQGRFPLILAGRCMTALGVVAGLGSGRTGVVWLDSHGDFNTPETTRSGMLDGMAGAVIAGRCWARVAETVPGFVPVSESRYVLVGARDLDRAEAELLDGSGVALLGPERVRGAGAGDVADALGDASEVYVHVDLDVLDPDRVGRANQYAAPDGLEARDVAAIAGGVADRCEIGAATLSAYDPSFDPEGGVAEAAMEIAERIIGAVAARRA